MLPVGAAIQAGIGAAQTIGGWIQQHKATKALEKLQSPTYNPNKSILDYYDKALAKYNVNPYQTDLYRMQQRVGDRNVSSGLNALGSRGMALAGVNNLLQQRSDNLLKAGVEAEQIQGQNLNRVGNAAGMKAQEEGKAFDINQYQPFERKYNLLAQKAGGGTQIANAGIGNVFGGLQGVDQMKMINQIYGGDNYGGGSSMIGGSGLGAASYGNSVFNSLNRNRGFKVG